MKAKNLVIIIIICCLIAVIASLIASSYPDGLEWVAEKIGFLKSSEGKEAFTAPMPDYMIPWIKKPLASGATAAIIGTIIVFACTYVLGRIFRKK